MTNELSNAIDELSEEQLFEASITVMADKLGFADLKDAADGAAVQAEVDAAEI